MQKIKEFVKRDESVVTGKKNLELLYSLKDFPVFFGCVDTPGKDDLSLDMDWVIEKETGVIQLDKLVPLEILYKSQHADGYGPTWMEHYVNFASYIKKNVLSDGLNNILEVGGGVGALAKIVTEENKNVEWTMLEPNPPKIESEKIRTIKGFMDENFKYNGTIDAIVFSHVIEHAYDPNAFLSAASKILKTGKYFVFSYPNLLEWLKKKHTNSINFEHTMLLTDAHLDYLLPKHGFEVINKEAYKDHSFFYTAKKVENPKIPTPVNKYDEYKKEFLEFINYHKKMIDELNSKMEETSLPIYLFGAHIFSHYLIFLGLKTEKIIAILDNSATKQGKRLYGTRYIIESPKILKDLGPVAIILKAGPYNEEIKKDILENINSEAIFW